VPLTSRHLRTGIPRLDRFLEGGCESGQITLLQGPAGFVNELTSRFAVNGIAQLRRPVMFIDGGNSADPYGFSAVCRRAHLDAREVLEQIYIARAFTVYQLDTLMAQMVEERINALSPALVIVSCLNTMYLDPDVKWEEAQALFHNDIRILHELTRKYRLVTLITNHSGQKSYNVMELERTLRAVAGHCIDVKAKSRYKLRLVRNNGAAVLEYRPLPPYQCSLDEFCPGGILDG
jgi:predicted ATP-dependent serine protease